MIFEMKLIEYNNPSNRTYSNKNCGGGGISSRSSSSSGVSSVSSVSNGGSGGSGGGGECKTGFLFCLVDLPFRNPQNCSLGDFTTPVLGANNIVFDQFSNSFDYKFTIKKLPSVSKKT